MNEICVSVIVPAYNSSATLASTLQAILSQRVDVPYEIIVIDDGSTDKTARIVKKFPSVIYFLQTNAGPASARNHGARVAQGKFLAFTDSDCTPQSDWLAQLLSGFNDGGIGVVCGSYGITNKEFLLARCIHREIIFRHQRLMPDFPKAFGGYNFCAKKSVYDGVGGFNETYRRASGEDNDLSYKILHAGYRIYFNRAALVDHVHPTQVWRYLKEQARHGFWRVRMYADYPHMARGDGYTFWKDVIEMPLAIGCLAGIIITLFGGLGFVQMAQYFLLPFLVFEIACACFMINDFIGGIYFGIVTLLRAFARLFGFSTGIFHVFCKTKEKKVK